MENNMNIIREIELATKTFGWARQPQAQLAWPTYWDEQDVSDCLEPDCCPICDSPDHHDCGCYEDALTEYKGQDMINRYDAHVFEFEDFMDIPF
jgi:hypothetical protein